ncbi:MAG: ParB/RepB/Spo0J family partition protein [Adlercreutzia equolifaciens]
MPRESAIPIDLPSLDDLFTTQAERDEVGCEKVGVIPLYMIDPFPTIPSASMTRLARHGRERFQIRRARARAREAERRTGATRYERPQTRALPRWRLEALPAVVREMTYDEAVIAMVDANIQRENVLPSEKAFAYKMKIDALSRQGYRSDLTCAPVGHKLANARSRDIVAEQSGESKSQVQRYVRLTHLNPDLLDMVDGGAMAMRPAVEISYLSEREQDDLLDAMGMEACTPSHAQAIRMRRLSEQGALSREAMASIMGERKPNQVEQFRIPREKIERFFKPGTSREAVEARIVKALELLERHERKRARER